MELDRWIIPPHPISSLHLPNGCSFVQVGELVVQVTNRVKVNPDTEYKMLGVKWYGEGTFHRETVRGSSLSAKYVTPAVTNSFMYNRLFAWKGSFSVVPEPYSDCFVSNEFPQFIVNEDRILPLYLYLFFMCDNTIKAVNKASIGSAAVSRNRFKEEDFLHFFIPLPPLSVQQAILMYWRKAQDEIIEAKQRLGRLKVEIDLQFLNNLGLKPPSQAQLPKAFAFWWNQLSRWDVSFVQNLGNNYRSHLYPNVLISDVVQPLYTTTKRSDTKSHPHELYNYIGMANVEAETGMLVDFKPVFGETIESSCVIFDQEHILYGKLRPYLRKVIVPSEYDLMNGIASSEFITLKPHATVLRDYLAQYLRSSAVEIQARQAIGARMPRISTDALLSFSIPLPPLNVQADIVLRVQIARKKIAKEREFIDRRTKELRSEVEAFILGTKKLEGDTKYDYSGQLQQA
jgi:restriction endonuclease S subunit